MCLYNNDDEMRSLFSNVCMYACIIHHHHVAILIKHLAIDIISIPTLYESNPSVLPSFELITDILNGE